MTVDLCKILEWLDIRAEKLNIPVSGLCHDSRKITSGDAFIALSGADNHGIDFAYQVQRAGACAIIAETIDQNNAKPKGRQQPLRIPVIEIENLSDKLGKLASNFYRNPSDELTIMGITGTNGKTSSAWLLLQAWDKLDIKGAYIGTLGYGTLKQMHPLENTTPNALHLQRILAQFVNDGITHVSIEVSSHGLSLGRVNGVKFNGAALTNISRDHLDFHQTMQQYSDAKKMLFDKFNPQFMVVNQNDYYGKKWQNEIDRDKISYASEDDQADLNAKNITLCPDGIAFDLIYDRTTYQLHTSLLGHFNIDNIMLVIGILIKQGIEIDRVIPLLKHFIPVPGRMNSIKNINQTIKSPLIIVDYAHTPDAVKQVLMALQKHNKGKLWCILGCGGNRDKGKRPQMGHIAETLADIVIITDDNPRFEDSQQIVDDILMGMNSKPLVIHNREAAIKHAINNASDNDLILIAGKGHETYQLIKGHYHPFDDRIIAQELLNKYDGGQV